MNNNNRKFYDSPIMILWAILTIAIALFIIFLSSVNAISLHSSNIALPIFVMVAFFWSYDMEIQRKNQLYKAISKPLSPNRPQTFLLMVIKQLFQLFSQLQVEGICMKYSYVRSKCQVCGKDSLIQLFFRGNGEFSYGRARHYLGQKEGKPQFKYHPQSMDSLKDLLKSQNITLDTEKAISGQIGQVESKEVHDLKSHEKSLNQQNVCGRRLVWFRTLAFQANDPGFKSRRPHQIFT